jgi:hypothetical protein
MAKKRNRFINQAALEALVRFGPELSGLKELQREAIMEYATGIKQAHGAARGIVGTIDQARPGVRKIYDDAGVSASKHASMLSGDVAALPGVANSIKAGAQLEGTHALAALRDAQSAALTDLQSRRVAAKEGEAFAVQRAHTELVDSLAKVLGRKQDLRREQGAFTALTARELQQSEQQRQDNLSLGRGRIRATERGQNVTKRGQTLSHQDRIRQQNISHADRVAAQKQKAANAKGKGNWQSKDKHDQWASAIDDITSQANRLLSASRQAKKPLSRAQLVQALSTGRRPDAKTGDPGRKPYPADLRMSAALDLATGGHLSRETQRRLHARGYSIRALGLSGKTYGRWKKQHSKGLQGIAGIGG